MANRRKVKSAKETKRDNEIYVNESGNPKELQENRSPNKKCQLISHHTQTLIDTTDPEGLQERNRSWNEKTKTKCKLTSHHTQTDVAWQLGNVASILRTDKSNKKQDKIFYL